MRVVSENSEQELARRKAEAAREEAAEVVGAMLRELAANIMRVTRGAGKPWEIGRQTGALINSMVEYREAVGHYPSSEEISNALSLDLDPEVRARMSQENMMEIYARQRIVHGSLQIAASHLLGQRAQEAAGRHEMHEGMRDWDRAIEELNKRWQAEYAQGTRRSSRNSNRPTRNKQRPEI
jgi:hypothetical protein